MGQGKIKGVKRREVRLAGGGGGGEGGLLAVPCERRGGMLDGHIQSREGKKQ